jgi:filamentous hemagglutinin family protein
MGRKQSSAGRWAAATFFLGLFAAPLTSGAREIKGIGESHGGALPGVAYLLPQGLGKKVPTLLAHGGGKLAALPENKGTTTLAPGINAFLSPAIIQPSKAAVGVVSDGSLGTGKVTFNRGTYTIPASVGTQAGGNLFESFSQFNLTATEVADFLGPSTVADIIARITGGSASSINGSIESSIQGANLFLINPSGIMFGPHASLNLTGAFTVSTANYVKLADGGKYIASFGANDTLTAGAVTAFGFLGTSPAPVSCVGSQLSVPPGTGLNIIAGNVTLKSPSGDLTTLGARLNAQSGEITLFCAASPGEVPFSLALPGAGYGAARFTTLGSLTVVNNSFVDIDGAGGGIMVIRAGSIAIAASSINLANSGATPGGSLTVMDRGALDLTGGGEILTEAQGSGNGGNLTVTAGNTLISGVDFEASQYQSEIAVNSTSLDPGGNAGNLHENTAGALDIEDGGTIGSVTSGVDNSGAVNVTAHDITVAGAAPGDALSAIINGSNGAGVAGPLSVIATGALNVQGGAEIGSPTAGRANSGNVTVSAERITLAGTTPDGKYASGIISQNLSPGLSGGAGNVSVAVAGALEIEGGAEIDSTTDSLGQGGDVKVIAREVTISGATPSDHSSGIFAESNSPTQGGSAGDVVVKAAGEVDIQNGGAISSSTSGLGDGGDVTVSGQDITIAGTTPDHIYSSGIFVDTESPTQGGAAGNVVVGAVADLTITNDGEIDSSTSGSGKGGTVEATARNITISDASAIDANSYSFTQGGAAGNVFLRAAGALDIESHSYVDSSTNGLGNDGTVALTARDITISGESAVGALSDSDSQGAAAGDVVVNAAGTLDIETGGVVSASSFGLGKGGDVQVSAGDISISEGGIAVDSLSQGEGGLAGNVNLSAGGLLYIGPLGLISSSTAGRGNGGNLRVTAQSAVLSGGGIFAVSVSSGAGGAAGDITVTVDQNLDIEDGSVINSSTAGLGKGGKITVNAGEISISGASANGEFHSGIYAQSQSAALGGEAGDITVVAIGSLDIENGGGISSSTDGGGMGGTVNVSAQNIIVSGESQISANSSSSTQGGAAGGLSIQCDNLTLDDGGTISTNAAAVSAGDITVNVGSDATLEGQSSISSSAGISGGNITLNVGDLLYVLDSSITATAGSLRNVHGTSNPGAGNGGNITVDPEFIVLNDSLISANAAAGQGGNILLESSYYLNSGSAVTATGATSGTIIITSPELDLSGALAGLPSTPLGAETQLQETCAMAVNGDFSSFLAVGQGDVEAAPDEAQGGSGDGGRELGKRGAHRKPGRGTASGL